MKSSFVRVISILLSAVLLIGCLPAMVFAASPTLWASPVKGTAETARPISAVKWWYDSEDLKYYLFMPSDGELSTTQLWFEGADTCTLDGTTVTNGQQLALEAKDYTVNFDGTDYPLCVMKSANIGSLYLTTESGSMSKIDGDAAHEYREGGSIKYVNEKGKTVYDGEMSEIKGRGNATWRRAKKPYQFKLPKKQDLIGAGKHKTWILLANYLERTMVRNKVIYDLANDAGLTNSCESTYVDLYCNGEYRGTYQLCEKVQIGDNRIEINDLEGATEDVNSEDLDSYPTFGNETADGKTNSTCKGFEIPNDPKDITGGYLLELEDHADRYATEVSGFVTSRGQRVTIKEPECASRVQVEYIFNFFQEFEDALYADDGINPNTGKHYSEYFDITSLARKYIIEEFTKNIDVDVTSQYFYKPSDSESTVGYCGPVWDYDNSLGNYITGTATDPTGIFATKGNIAKQLYGHEDFMNTLRAEWESNFVPLLREQLGLAESDESTKVMPLDELEEMLTPSAAMNFTYWSNIDTVDGENYNNTGSTFPEHYDYLKNYMTERYQYLDSVWSTDDIASTPIAKQDTDVPNILDYNGTATTYTVDSEEGLQKLADLVTAGTSMKGVTILQTADIHLTKEFTPGGYVNPTPGTAVEPKGNYSVFRGTLNGQGYKIYNLNINKPQQDGVGLFTIAYRATLIDVHIASGNIVGYNRVGGICGYGDASTFIRCSNAATITGDAAGVDGNAGIAGVARKAESPTATATFTSCYNTGSITGGVAAGICGWGQSNVVITNCYNSGTLKALSAKSDGCRPIARSGYTTAEFSTCYYLNGQGTEVNGAGSFEAAGLTNGTLLAKLNAGSKVWKAGSAYPEHLKTVKVTRNILLGEKTLRTETLFYPENTEIALAPGNGAFAEKVKLNSVETTAKTAVLTADSVIDVSLATLGEPITAYSAPGSYYISTAEELQHFLTLTKTDSLTGSTVYLIDDIDAGTVTTGGSFGGTLNGQFSRLQGLAVPLFESVTATGNVRKLKITDSDLTGNGVIAAENAGEIAYIITENLVVRGTAGIVGNNSGTVNACSTNGFIISGTTAGGIASANSGLIRNCINNARIVVPGGVAGGIAAVSTGTVKNCLNRGMLNGGSNYAIANGSAADSYHWDWCVGLGNDKNAVADVEIAASTFMTDLTGGYWEVGKKVPTLKTPTFELGDVNSDGQIRLEDAVCALRALAGKQYAGVTPEAADINGGSLTSADLSLMLRHLLGTYTI